MLKNKAFLVGHATLWLGGCYLHLYYECVMSHLVTDEDEEEEDESGLCGTES